MPFYKLEKRKATHLVMDELILAKDEVGKVISLSVKVAREIPEELLPKAEKYARRMGYVVKQTKAPAEQEPEQQPVGDDVRGMSPTMGGSSDTTQGAPRQSPPGALSNSEEDDNTQTS